MKPNRYNLGKVLLPVPVLFVMVALAAVMMGSPANAATPKTGASPDTTKSIDVTQSQNGSTMTTHIEFDKPVSKTKARKAAGQAASESPLSLSRMSSSGSTIILHCGQPETRTTSKGAFHLTHPCGSKSAKWGYRTSKSLQKHIVGSVHESGMKYSRGGATKTGKAHKGTKRHYFTGKFSPVRSGQTGKYSDKFSFLTNYSFGGVSKTSITVKGNFNVAS